MSKNARIVHLVTVGRDGDRIKAGLRRMSADKVYLLHSADGVRASDGEREDFASIAGSIAEDLRAAGYDVSLAEIPPYDLGGMVYAIMGIAKEEMSSGDVRFMVNISGGTNLMAGAATAASYLLGAEVYYVTKGLEGDVLEDRVVTFPTPVMPDPSRLGKSAVACLRFIAASGGVMTNARIAGGLGWSAQTASHNVKVLRNWHMVEVTRGVEGNSRESRITLTDHGRLFAMRVAGGE